MSNEIPCSHFASRLIRNKAHQLCRRSDHTSSDLDDLIQEMKLWLLEKAPLYDPARGTAEAFIAILVDSWAKQHLRARRRGRRKAGLKAISLERTIIKHDGDELPLTCALRDEDLERRTHPRTRHPIEEFETQEAVAHAMKQLDLSERKIAILVGKHGVAGAACAMGVSRRQVRNALARMRKRFEDAGLSPE